MIIIFFVILSLPKVNHFEIYIPATNEKIYMSSKVGGCPDSWQITYISLSPKGNEDVQTDILQKVFLNTFIKLVPIRYIYTLYHSLANQKYLNQKLIL